MNKNLFSSGAITVDIRKSVIIYIFFFKFCAYHT